MIHNHGSEEGPGLSCNELRLPNGTRIGSCLVPADLTLELYEKIYDRFVVENYYGGNSEPITPEYFEEAWSEMIQSQKQELIDLVLESEN